MGLFAWGKTVEEAREVARLEGEKRDIYVEAHRVLSNTLVSKNTELCEETHRLEIQTTRLEAAEERLKREMQRIGELMRQVEAGNLILEAVKRTEVTRVRVATIRLDPRELTSNIRHVATNIKVEYDPATFRYVIYADEMPDEAGFNAMRAVVQAALDVDRT